MIRTVRKLLRKTGSGDLVEVEVDEVNLQALKSKTVWFGIVQLAGSAALTLMSDGYSEAAILAFVTGVVTILLRAVTSAPLSEK